MAKLDNPEMQLLTSKEYSEILERIKTKYEFKPVWNGRKKAVTKLNSTEKIEETDDDEKHETSGNQTLSKISQHCHNYEIESIKSKLHRGMKISCDLGSWVASLSKTLISRMESSETADLSSKPVFNPLHFKAKQEGKLSEEVKRILRKDPEKRTEDMVQLAFAELMSFEELTEYPVSIQKEFAKNSFFQDIPANKTIIREGHIGETFYVILSGEASITIVKRDKFTNEPYLETVSAVGKGTAFGEIALLQRSFRTATVTSTVRMQLLTISSLDYYRIFMNVGEDGLTKHARFIMSLPFMKAWPTEHIEDDLTHCIYRYFKKDTIITENIIKDEWIYIIFEGSCTVFARIDSKLKQLKEEGLKGKSDNRIYLPPIDIFSNRRASFKCNEKDDVSNNCLIKTNFITVEKLHCKEVFGLEFLPFMIHLQIDPIDLSLVSDGAGCILLKRSFFIEYCDETVIRNIHSLYRTYPSKSKLEVELENNRKWVVDKKKMMDKLIDQNKIKYVSGYFIRGYCIS